jgi:hypothetical protein
VVIPKLTPAARGMTKNYYTPLSGPTDPVTGFHVAKRARTRSTPISPAPRRFTFPQLLAGVGGCYTLRCGIDPKHLYHVGDGIELQQGATGEFVVPTQQVRIEDVLPRTAAHRA